MDLKGSADSVLNHGISPLKRGNTLARNIGNVFVSNISSSSSNLLVIDVFAPKVLLLCCLYSLEA